MAKRHIIFALAVCCGCAAQPERYIVSGGGDDGWKPALENLIAAVKDDNPKKVCDFISYPLRRQNPIPPVKDKADCVARYNDIFDDKLKSAIADSDADKDWGRVGWRGVMYTRAGLTPIAGAIWLTGETDGKIRAIAYQSDRESEIKEKLIAEERAAIYGTLRDFKNNAVVLETDKFLIRIDYMEDRAYRYAAWSKPKTMRDEPDIIIKGGTVKNDGNGGNHSYIFKNGDHVYSCGITRVGTAESPPADLTIYKTDRNVDIKNWDWNERKESKIILSVPAKIIME